MRLTDQQRREAAELAAQIDAAPWGAATGLVEAAARTYGISIGTMWARLREIRKPKRKPRSDLGKMRRAEEDARAVLALQQQTESKDPRTGVVRRTPTEVALEAAEQRGMLKGPISRATVDRYAQQRRMRQVKRIWRPKRARRPNDVHTIDASGSKLLRAVGCDEKTGEWLIGIRPRDGYTRKRREEPYGVWAVGLVDDCTGVAYVEYCVAPGESADMVLNFLRAPWGGDPRCPIRGLPAVANCDHGPFRESERIQNLMDSLGVRFLPRTPDNPNTGGKVENRWRTLWRRFEMTFRWEDPATVIPLSQLNRRVAIHTAHENARENRWERGCARIELYQAGLVGQQVRLMPEDLGEALFSDVVRKVRTDASIQYMNNFFRVDDSLAGHRVEVLKNADGALLVREPDTGELFDAEPLQPTSWDEYDPRHFTEAQRIEQEAADIPLAETPHYGGADEAGTVVHFTPGATEAKPETPWTQRERVKRFSNADEAFERAVVIIGQDAFMAEPMLAERVEQQIEEFKLDRDRLEEAWLELRDMRAS